jgi:hypothetical protein
MSSTHLRFSITHYFLKSLSLAPAMVSSTTIFSIITQALLLGESMNRTCQTSSGEVVLALSFCKSSLTASGKWSQVLALGQSKQRFPKTCDMPESYALSLEITSFSGGKIHSLKKWR